MNIFRIESIDFSHTTLRMVSRADAVRVNLNEVKVRGTYFREDGSETELSTPLDAEEYEILQELMKRVSARVDASLTKL